MNDTEIDEWLSCAKERYETTIVYSAESKNDPPSDPYHSKYKAKKVLCELDLEVNSKFDVTENFQLRYLSALFKFKLGVISMETEDLHASEVFLEGSWDKIQDICETPDCCTLAVNILNYLGILWSNRGEASKASKYLKRAEELYEKYNSTCEACPYNFISLFSSSVDSKIEDRTFFEKSYTYTGYYLAQVYEELNENELAAKYCFMTLKRQERSEDYDPIEWAVNSSTLSQYFSTKNEFAIALHLLACSRYMLNKHEMKLKEEYEDKEHDVWETFNQARANVSQYWLRYCSALFQFSMNEISNEHSENNGAVFDKTWLPDKLLNNDDVLELEKNVGCNVVRDFADARQLFLSAQNYLNEAKLFYTLNNFANDHVQLLQEHSKLYKYLIFYENDNDRKCKMYKRRADILEGVLSRLNPQYYLTACRQLQFELGEIFSEMMNLKISLANCEPQDMPILAVKKINSLIMRSIKYFDCFLDTLRDKNKVFPAMFAEELVRPALIAHCYLGRCYHKLIESQEVEHSSNLYKSKELYDYIENYVQRNPSHSDFIKNEIDVIKDMSQILETKIMSLNSNVIY